MGLRASVVRLHYAARDPAHNNGLDPLA
jgi:hypothetical protein